MSKKKKYFGGVFLKIGAGRIEEEIKKGDFGAFLVEFG